MGSHYGKSNRCYHYDENQEKGSVARLWTVGSILDYVLYIVDPDGAERQFEPYVPGEPVAIDEQPPIPATYSLTQNYPNPFNAATSIRYGLPEDCMVSLTIYSVAGQRVRVLVSENQEAGYEVIHWDGRNDKGHEVSSGIYFYRLVAGNFEQTKKMVLMR